jgi:hypothetical protein
MRVVRVCGVRISGSVNLINMGRMKGRVRFGMGNHGWRQWSVCTMLLTNHVGSYSSVMQMKWDRGTMGCVASLGGAQGARTRYATAVPTSMRLAHGEG